MKGSARGRQDKITDLHVLITAKHYLRTGLATTYLFVSCALFSLPSLVISHFGMPCAVPAKQMYSSALRKSNICILTVPLIMRGGPSLMKGGLRSKVRRKTAKIHGGNITVRTSS